MLDLLKIQGAELKILCRNYINEDYSNCSVKMKLILR